MSLTVKLGHMLVFSHLGIGRFISKPFLTNAPIKAFYLSTLLPDLIDKSLYFGNKYLNHGEAEWISCTRTIGHSGIFAVAILTPLYASQKNLLVRAIFLGLLSHLFLDLLNDFLNNSSTSSTLIAALFPFLGSFYVFPFESPVDQIAHHLQSPFYTLGFEILGLIALYTFHKRTKLTRSNRNF